LDENEYIWPPDGVAIERRCDLYQLKKAPYGLEQAPRAWYKKNIDTKLKQMGFISIINESYLYHSVHKGSLNLSA